MGKKSFKNRPKRGKMPASSTEPVSAPRVHPAVPEDHISEDDFSSVDHSNLHHGYKSYSDALSHCESDGWDEARFGPEFTSTQLTDALQANVDTCLANHNCTIGIIHIVDRTHTIPNGCEGNYSVLPTTLFLTNKEAILDSSKAFLFLRTKANTSAFLSGMMAGHIAERCGDHGAARDYVKKASATPAGMLLHDGKQMVFPTIAVQGTEEIVSNMLTAMILDKPDEFTCALCNSSFMKYCGSSWGTTPFIAFNCDHAFHPWCAQYHWEQGGHTCPKCDEPVSENSQPKHSMAC